MILLKCYRSHTCITMTFNNYLDAAPLHPKCPVQVRQQAYNIFHNRPEIIVLV